MSPRLLWSLMMLFLAYYFQNAASSDISDVTLASLISYDALFSIILLFEHFLCGFRTFISIILASWDLKVGIIRNQWCHSFGIIGFSWCLILGLMMLKWCLKRCTFALIKNSLMYFNLFSFNTINRPGVAGAVLQTPLSLIH